MLFELALKSYLDFNLINFHPIQFSRHFIKNYMLNKNYANVNNKNVYYAKIKKLEKCVITCYYEYGDDLSENNKKRKIYFKIN